MTATDDLCCNTSLSTAENQLCIDQRVVIRVVLADSFLILVRTYQVRLKCGKQ